MLGVLPLMQTSQVVLLFQYSLLLSKKLNGTRHIIFVPMLCRMMPHQSVNACLNAIHLWRLPAPISRRRFESQTKWAAHGVILCTPALRVVVKLRPWRYR